MGAMGGKDHLIIAHHPNSMLDARSKLGSAMFVLADFGRYPVDIANLGKDIIAPYRHLVRTIPNGESAPFDKRPILAYFQGAIYRKDVSSSSFSSYDESFKCSCSDLLLLHLDISLLCMELFYPPILGLITTCFKVFLFLWNWLIRMKKV